MIKLKDVNSLVYQMESLGSKTANCITPEEQSPLHRNASLFISYIYHQWFWSLLYKKKNIKKSHIYTHKSASGRPLLLIILVFDSREFTSNLSCKYFDTLSPHTSSNLHFILFECTYSWLLVWLAIKAWRLPMHCPIVQSKRAL